MKELSPKEAKGIMDTVIKFPTRTLYKLTILDRLILLNIFNQINGNMATIKLIRAAENEIGITEEEHAEFAIVMAGNNVSSWNTEKEKTEGPKDFAISNVVANAIKEYLLKVDGQKGFNKNFIDIYDQFVPESERPEI